MSYLFMAAAAITNAIGIKKIHDSAVSFSKAANLDKTAQFGVRGTIENFSKIRLHMIFHGAIGALLGGGFAYAAYELVGRYAKASSGLPISLLRGAARTDAILCYFGGGSIMTGGFGREVGLLVIIGLVLGPTLWAIGNVAKRESGKELERAGFGYRRDKIKKKYESVSKIEAELDAMKYDISKGEVNEPEVAQK